VNGRIPSVVLMKHSPEGPTTASDAGTTTS